MITDSPEENDLKDLYKFAKNKITVNISKVDDNVTEYMGCGDIILWSLLRRRTCCGD